MPTAHYIEHDGTKHTVDVEDGATLMEGAQMNVVPGIDAECGGMCSCATCHCYIEGEWADKIPAPLDPEKAMLKTANEPKDSSRLACQIVMNEDLEGIEIRLPPSQH